MTVYSINVIYGARVSIEEFKKHTVMVKDESFKLEKNKWLIDIEFIGGTYDIHYDGSEVKKHKKPMQLRSYPHDMDESKEYYIVGFHIMEMSGEGFPIDDDIEKLAQYNNMDKSKFNKLLNKFITDTGVELEDGRKFQTFGVVNDCNCCS